MRVRGWQQLGLSVLFVLLPSLGVSGAWAQPAYQVADLNITRTGGTWLWPYGSEFVEAGGTVLFTAADGIHGNELWRTDGTTAGTSLVRDICPGACSSNPWELTVVGGTVFFRADDGANGAELWRSDGTAAGTSLVADLVPGLEGSLPVGMFDLGGTLLFSATTAATGRELWTSDGTAAGTGLLADLNPGAADSSPTPWARLGSIVLLSAEDAAHGRELWRTDGTAAGTTLVEDIRPGSGSSHSYVGRPLPGVLQYAVAAGRLFFPADDGVTGDELWVTDGTAAGTSLVRDIEPGPGSSSPFSLAVLNNEVFFRAWDTAAGSELWKSDGTEAGTVRLADIRPGSGSSSPWQLTAAGSRVFFSASDGTAGWELWASDGTAAGTALVADIRPGSGDSIPPWGLAAFTDMGGSLLFFADDGVHGTELWESDGTAAGTVLLGDLNPGPGPSYFLGGPLDFRIVSNGWWYFRAWNSGLDLELWKSDGTAAGTQQVAEVNAQASAFDLSYLGLVWGPHPLADVNGTLFFQASDGLTGIELWQTDGTAGGTSLVRDIAPAPPGADSSVPFELTALGNEVLFSADDGSHGRELWSSDGTSAGTQLLKDLEPASLTSGGFPWWLTRAGGLVYFNGYDGQVEKLWKSDGTPTGTVPVRDTAPTAYAPSELVALGTTLLYSASGSEGEELWKTDGTEAGTLLVKDIRPGTASAVPNRLTAVGSLVFFSADDGITGRELWTSDGTEAGTVRVKDIRPGAASAIPYFEHDQVIRSEGSAAAGGRLFFVADDGVAGQELWASDSTEAGTVLVKDVRPGAASSEIRWLTAAGGRVFFVADDGTHGRELWTSDGTTVGTVLVEDLQPGAGSALPEQLTAAGNVLLFSAFDEAGGREPWLSDGTAAGTSRLQQIAPGSQSSSPTAFTLSGPRVYFPANDNTTGFELWAVPRAALGAALAAGKTVSGGFFEEGTVTYTIVLSNQGLTLQPDNPGAELTDVLPSGLALTGASATAGTVSTDPGTRTVTWNGSLAAGASVTITIQATVQHGTLGTTLANQAAISWDGDADGINESAGTSDDPGAPGSGDPTPLTVVNPALGFYTFTPCRVFDTRNTTPLASGSVRTFPITGSCGIPATARAVAVNLTVAGSTAPGSVAVYPAGIAAPGTSNLNFRTGATRANNAVLGLRDGALDAKAILSPGGTVHLILDVVGYFQ